MVTRTQDLSREAPTARGAAPDTARRQPPALVPSYDLTPQNVRCVRMTHAVSVAIRELADPYVEQARFLIGFHDIPGGEIVIDDVAPNVYRGTSLRAEVDSEEVERIEAWYRQAGQNRGVVALAHTHVDQRATEASVADRFNFSGWAEELHRAFCGVILAPYGDLKTTDQFAEYGWNRSLMVAYVAPVGGGPIYTAPVKVGAPR